MKWKQKTTATHLCFLCIENCLRMHTHVYDTLHTHEIYLAQTQRDNVRNIRLEYIDTVKNAYYL